MQTIPIHALFAEDNINPNENLVPHPRDVVSNADVILVVDVMTGNQSLVFGCKALEKIVASGRNQQLQVLFVELDTETDELERLIALVKVLKGSHDYA